MTTEQILQLRNQGEATMAQFKERIIDKYDVACELVAMSNTKGGLLVVGVNDKSGSLNPLSYQEVQETTALLANMASENVIPGILLDIENITTDEGSIVVATVKEGLNKPYHDNKGIVWVKNGAGGIPRAMEAKPNVNFLSDDSRHEFIITIRTNQETNQESNEVGNEEEHQVKHQVKHQETNQETGERPKENEERPKETEKDPKKIEESPKERPKETPKERPKETTRLDGRKRDIVNFCSVPRTTKEIFERLGVTYDNKSRKRYITPLLDLGYLEMTIPENPRDRNQKYRKVIRK